MGKKKAQSGPKPGSGQGGKKKKKVVGGVDRGFATASVASTVKESTAVEETPTVVPDIDTSKYTNKKKRNEKPDDTPEESSILEEDAELTYSRSWVPDTRVPEDVMTTLPPTSSYTATDDTGKRKTITYTLSQPATPLSITQAQEARIVELMKMESGMDSGVVSGGSTGKLGNSGEVGYDFLRSLHDFLNDKVQMSTLWMDRAIAYAYKTQTSDVRAIIDYVYLTHAEEGDNTEDIHVSISDEGSAADRGNTGNMAGEIDLMAQQYTEVTKNQVQAQSQPVQIQAEPKAGKADATKEDTQAVQPTKPWWMGLRCPFEAACDVEYRLEIEEFESIDAHVYGSGHISANDMLREHNYWKNRYINMKDMELLYNRFWFFWSLEKLGRLESRTYRKAKTPAERAQGTILTSVIQDARFHIDAISALGPFVQDWVDKVDQDLYAFKGYEKEPEKKKNVQTSSNVEPEEKKTESELKKPESASEESESESEESESESEESESELKKSVNEPKKLESEHKILESKPKKSENEPKKLESEPKISESDPKNSECEPISESVPKKLESEPKKSESEPKKSESEPKKSESEPEKSGFPAENLAAEVDVVASKVEKMAESENKTEKENGTTPERMHEEADSVAAQASSDEEQLNLNMFDVAPASQNAPQADSAEQGQENEEVNQANFTIDNMDRYIAANTSNGRLPTVLLAEMIKKKFGTKPPAYRLITPRRPHVGGFPIAEEPCTLSPNASKAEKRMAAAEAHAAARAKANALLDHGEYMFVPEHIAHNYALVTFDCKVGKKTEKVSVAMGSDGVSWHGPCVSKKEAYEYVALLALKRTFADLPQLHMTMHKIFQDLWRLWDALGERKIRQAIKQEAERRDTHVRDIMEKIGAPDPSMKPDTPAVVKEAMSGSNTEIADDSEDATLSRGRIPHTPAISEKLAKIVSTNMDSARAASLSSVTEGLPVFSQKDVILNAVRDNQIIIVSGATGSGKSTQVPKYIVQQILLDGTPDLQPFVVCTEPRRISAVSIATRVSAEMGEPGVGVNDSVVGYSVRLDTRRSANTRLLFCTTGVLLRWLQSDHVGSEISHIIIDEVHERTVQTDFLLGLLKPVLKLRPDLKVILMSATLDATLFDKYFRASGCSQIAHVDVEGRTFPVHPIFLQQAVRFADYVIEDDSPYARRAVYDAATMLALENTSKSTTHLTDSAKHLMKGVSATGLVDGGARGTTAGVMDPDDRALATVEKMNTRTVNFDLIESLIISILRTRAAVNEGMGDGNGSADIAGTGVSMPLHGAILVFFPGVGEIKRMLDQLEWHPDIAQGKYSVVIVPLHSKLTSQEQQQVFKDYGSSSSKKRHRNTVKIVLSTNIAETGVTIPDVTVVIDTCRQREMRYDDVNGTDKLEECFVSQASALQRRGRAGRVQTGVCFHLISDEQYSNFSTHARPEMLRVALDNLCLQLLKMNVCNPQTWLSGTLSPPSTAAVSRAVEKLTTVGAIDTYTVTEPKISRAARAESAALLHMDTTRNIHASENASTIDATGAKSSEIAQRVRLTALGKMLADLPVDVCVGKMLVLGVVFQCLEPMLCIAAAVSHHKSIFLQPMDGPDLVRARAQHRKFATSFATGSDHLTIWRVYKEWSALIKGSNKTTKGSNIGTRGGGGGIALASEFCKDNLLDQQALKAIDSLRTDLWSNIKQTGVLAYLDRLYGASTNGGKSNWQLDSTELNVRSKNGPLLRGLILAGMYPHLAVRTQPLVAQPSGRGKGFKPRTTNLNAKKGPPEYIDGLRNVYTVPKSSVFQPEVDDATNLAKSSNNALEWVCYHSKAKISRHVYAQTISRTDAIALLLFGPRDVSIYHELARVVVGNWIQLQTSPLTAARLAWFKVRMDEVIRDRITGRAGEAGEAGRILDTAAGTLN